MISYLMKKLKLSYEETYKFMKSKKHNISINEGF